MTNNNVNKKKLYILECNGRNYQVFGDHWMTLERVWISQKMYFMPGSKVTISDEQGNFKTFIKE